MTNPNNILENNAIVGSSHHGYWYRLLEQLTGLSHLTNTAYAPYKQHFGRFTNNSVHSSGGIGVWIYPLYAPSASSDRTAQALFEGLVSWKYNKGIEWVLATTILIRDALVFDQAEVGIASLAAINYYFPNASYLRPIFYNAETGSAVINSVIIGDSHTSNSSITPRTALLVMIDRGLPLQNVTFINFPSNETSAIRRLTITDRCVGRCAGTC